MIDKPFYPRDTLGEALHSWWLVVALILIGAVAGWVFNRLQPPVYESVAEFTTSIDYSRTGVLTDVEEDQAIGLVGDVLYSAEVINRVIGRAGADGLSLDADTFRSMATPERKNYIWMLRVRHSDPQMALRIAGYWARAAWQEVTAAQQSAILAGEHQRFLDSLESCIARAVTAGPVQAQCYPQNLAALQLEINKTGEMVKQDRLASKGILPYLTVNYSQEPELPSRPVLFGRNQSMLSGALIGFLLAIWVIHLGLGERLRPRHA
jgi:hypothetical protein